ncbi:aminotransferase class I/II-fold pyridoxal phosphate-dependent enzyme [Aliiroseovarius sp. CAU 1755]
MIYADNNATGRRILNYVPELALLEVVQQGDMAEYVNPNADRGPVGRELKRALATLEGINDDQIVIDGSGLNRLKLLPNLYGAKSVVTIANDFPGYKAAATSCNLPHHEIPCGIWEPRLREDEAVKVVAALDRPIVFLSMPVTNPGQTVVGLDVAHAILQANPRAFVIIDSAYRRDNVLSEDYVRFALQHERVLYMNVAAKDLGSCGARASWMIGTKEMLDPIRQDVCPYPVSMHAARFLAKLAAKSHLVDKIHAVQRAAVDVYRDWLPSTGLKYKTGAGPWVLVHIGPDVSSVVKDLEESQGILVQDQAGKATDLTGWIRISANVPCDAVKVAAALSERMLAMKVA